MKGMIALAGLAAIVLPGCQMAPQARHEGVSFGAGNAIAANTALQMVDPWPWGVQHTELAVPADRDQYASENTATDDAGAVYRETGQAQ